MDITFIIRLLESILDEYNKVDTANDLTPYIQNVKPYGSTLTTFQNAISALNIDYDSNDGQIYCDHLQEIIIDKTGANFSFSDQPFNLYTHRDVSFSPALNKMLASAYVKGRITIFDFDQLKLSDYVELTMIDSSLSPYLKEYIKEYYRHSIQYGIKKLLSRTDVEKIEQYNIHDQESKDAPALQSKSHSASLSALNETLNRLSEQYGKTSVQGESLGIKRDTSGEFQKFMHNVLSAKLSEIEIQDFLERKTNGFQTDRLEIALFHIVNYIVTRPGFMHPDMGECKRRTEAILAKGEDIPIKSSYSSMKRCLVKVEDIETLFPEVFQNYYPLRDLVFRKLTDTYNTQKQIVPEIVKGRQRNGDEPEAPIKQIIFSDDATMNLVYEGLKTYFPGDEASLKQVLAGKDIKQRLIFPSNQNKLVEVFRRLKYNGFILNNLTEIQGWLCVNFRFSYKLRGTEGIKDLNKFTVWDLLSKGRSEPSKKLRIFNFEWLPYKSPRQLKYEAQEK